MAYTLKNLLQISLTNRCNCSCDYCPIKKWRNNLEYPDTLTNALLFDFLKNHISPSEWYIELTGGEPALYRELPALLDYLNANNYYGLIKTNGLLPIKENPNFKRIAAFHNIEKLPKYYDKILIIKHTPYWEEKVKLCSDIPYGLIDVRPAYPDTEIWQMKFLENIAFITPQGDLRECNAITDIKNPINDVKFISRKICYQCKTAVDFEIFF